MGHARERPMNMPRAHQCHILPVRREHGVHPGEMTSHHAGPHR
jgi:hypothetical protein